MRKAIFYVVQSVLVGACALTGYALTSAADTPSPTTAVRDFGLLGTWAVECSRPASPSNEHSLFSVTDAGGIWVFNDFGPDYDGMVYRVVDASLVEADKVSLRQILASDESIVLDIVMLKANDRIRIWSSRTAKGDMLVKDGSLSTTGDQQTRWAARCGEKRAAQ
jgi:hypothetical protein